MAHMHVEYQETANSQTSFVMKELVVDLFQVETLLMNLVHLQSWATQ